MTQRTSGLLAGALLALAAGGAGAAPLGLTPQAPAIEASGATIDYLELGDEGSLSAFGAAVDFADGVAAEGAELSFAVGVALDGDLVGATGGFDVLGEGGVLLDGELSRVGFIEDSIELEFASLGGSLAESFGSTALLAVDFDDALGANPFEGLADGGSYLAALTVSALGSPGGEGPDTGAPAPIPLPASGLLLGGALAAFALRRRR